MHQTYIPPITAVARSSIVFGTDSCLVWPQLCRDGTQPLLRHQRGPAVCAAGRRVQRHAAAATGRDGSSHLFGYVGAVGGAITHRCLTHSRSHVSNDLTLIAGLQREPAQHHLAGQSDGRLRPHHRGHKRWRALHLPVRAVKGSFAYPEVEVGWGCSTDW